MVTVGLAGLGKMGISHFAIIGAHPDVNVVGVSDPFGYLTGALNKYTGVNTFSDYTDMLDKVSPQAVIISTPSRFHETMVRTALERGIHVFCEKPFSLRADASESLAALAAEKRLVNQVGYHYRFVGAFQEVKRLLDANAIGRVTHSMAEAYGPVVTKAKGSTWRTKSEEGGGCLYDYAAHPLNLLLWYFGMPAAASGTLLKKIFSAETDDEVYSTLSWSDGTSAQLSVNWSDESNRKMTTKISIWGTEGRIIADRQECTVYLRSTATIPDGYSVGWNTRYTTSLTEPVGFYLRGEEYSAQLDHFVRQIEGQVSQGENSFVTAAETDRAIEMMLNDARAIQESPAAVVNGAPSQRRAFGLFSRSKK